MNATISLHVWVFMSGSWGGQRRVLYYLNPPNHLVVSSAPNTLFKISNFVVIAESLPPWRQRLGLHWSFTSQCGATYFKDASHLKLYHGHFPKRLNIFFCHFFQYVYSIALFVVSLFIIFIQLCKFLYFADNHLQLLVVQICLWSLWPN